MNIHAFLSAYLTLHVTSKSFLHQKANGVESIIHEIMFNVNNLYYVYIYLQIRAIVFPYDTPAIFFPPGSC